MHHVMTYLKTLELPTTLRNSLWKHPLGLKTLMRSDHASSPNINQKQPKQINFLSFSGGCGQLIEEVLSDFNDKVIKNTFVPKITKWAKEIFNFIIEWVRSLDPVRC